MADNPLFGFSFRFQRMVRELNKMDQYEVFCHLVASRLPVCITITLVLKAFSPEGYHGCQSESANLDGMKYNRRRER